MGKRFVNVGVFLSADSSFRHWVIKDTQTDTIWCRFPFLENDNQSKTVAEQRMLYTLDALNNWYENPPQSWSDWS